MALIDCKEPVFDRQVNQILGMLEEGIDRADIAEKLKYKNPVSSGKGKDNLILQGISKTELIISLFKQGELDAKDIAKQVGFDTHIELANYMKNKGFVWDSREGNYIKILEDKLEAVQQEESSIQLGVNASATEILENIIPLLKNQQKPNHINTSSEAALNLPRYQVKGMYGTKAVRMANILDLLVRDYSKERNIS